MLQAHWTMLNQPMPTSLASFSTFCDRLFTTYPNATYELNWDTPEQLLIATILAAQTRDTVVNRVTAALFADYPDLEYDWKPASGQPGK